MLSLVKLKKEGFVNDVNFKQTVKLLDNSLILTENERLSLVKMIPQQFSSGNLLYRASRDGFTATSFHEKCDGKANTITIIKNNFNYVFGGYTAAIWTSTGYWTHDPSAFIYRLRKYGAYNSKKFHIQASAADNAIIGYKDDEYNTNINHKYPAFGFGEDIHIVDRSDILIGSFSKLGQSYQSYPGYLYGKGDTQCFLAGTYNGWLTTEIEVYELY
jgi:hypothetical protein